MWEIEWRSEAHSTMSSFFPILDDLVKAHRTSGFSHVKRLITGHCTLKASLHRFGRSDSTQCDCGALSETVEHFVFHCPSYDTERAPLVDCCRAVLGVWPPKMKELGRHACVWAKFTSFVGNTGRLASNRRVAYKMNVKGSSPSPFLFLSHSPSI